MEAQVLSRMPGAEIVYFGSSFGAYITALYLTKRPHAGNRAFFRPGAFFRLRFVRKKPLLIPQPLHQKTAVFGFDFLMAIDEYIISQFSVFVKRNSNILLELLQKRPEKIPLFFEKMLLLFCRTYDIMSSR